MGDTERCRQANGAVARYRAEGDPAVARLLESDALEQRRRRARRARYGGAREQHAEQCEEQSRHAELSRR